MLASRSADYPVATAPGTDVMKQRLPALSKLKALFDGVKEISFRKHNAESSLTVVTMQFTHQRRRRSQIPAQGNALGTGSVKGRQTLKEFASASWSL